MVRTVSQVVRMSLVTAVFAFAFGACGGGVGSGSNNNQGLSFALLGFFAQDATSCSDTGVTEIVVPLTSIGDGFPGDVRTVVGLQNSLSGQAFNVQRLELSYFIPGASSQPPSDVTALPLTLGPGPGASDSSLPGSFGVLGNCAVANVPILTDDVRTWISLNRASLPGETFDILVTVSATGQATGGDVLTSNEQTIVLAIVPDTTIPGTGPSTGGGGASAGAEGSGGGGVAS